MWAKGLSYRAGSRTKRDSKAGISFIEMNDGSCLKSLQVIAEPDRRDYSELLNKITTGSAILAEGTVSGSPGKGQSVELRAERIHLMAGPTRHSILSRKRGTPSSI